jgi:hypothetical protein
MVNCCKTIYSEQLSNEEHKVTEILAESHLTAIAKKNLLEISRTIVEKEAMSDYLQLILIFTNAAQKAPYPLEVLSDLAKPQSLRVLFELLVEASPKQKLTVVQILKNLVRI